MELPAKRVPEEKQAVEFLANERTFLAWIRTSVSIISLGFVISRFRMWIEYSLHKGGEEGHSGGKIGGSFLVAFAMVGIGGLLAVLAAWRYHVVNRQIENGHVTADRGLIILVTVLVALLAVAMIVIILTSASK